VEKIREIEKIKKIIIPTFTNPSLKKHELFIDFAFFIFCLSPSPSPLKKREKGKI